MASTGEPWRLGRRPALDGLRGIAVLMVVVSHLVEGGAVHALGPAGVTVFFTLSGFLITALLLEEQQESWRIDLRAFYRRRALRLIPALVALVAGTTLIGAVVGGGFTSLALVVGTATYSSNWLEAAGLGAGSALAHTWSLAVEEQFYLLWPLAVIVSRRLHRRWLVGFLVAGILASASARFALAGEGWQRVYFGFDTHADALLVGCLLAVLLRGRPSAANRPLVAAVALLCLVPAVTAGFAFTLLLLPLVTAIVTAVAIYAAAQDGQVRWLSWGPLALVGKRSYGLYLWHWPSVLLANRLMHDPGPGVLLVTAIPVAWVVTLLSWRFIEEPFLRLKRRAAAPVSNGACVTPKPVKKFRPPVRTLQEPTLMCVGVATWLARSRAARARATRALNEHKYHLVARTPPGHRLWPSWRRPQTSHVQMVTGLMQDLSQKPPNQTAAELRTARHTRAR